MKIVLAIESSNSRGMGHLFRSLLYVKLLKTKRINYIYLINNDEPSLEVLKKNNIDYIIVNYADIVSNWEQTIIKDNKIDVWFNDKFETSAELARHVKETGCLFATLDDIGPGAYSSDLYFAGMIYPTDKGKKGKKNFQGKDFITLNPEIDNYKRIRNELKSILVTMGGSDPHGVTLEVVKELKKTNYNVTILIGPNFKFKTELDTINSGQFQIVQNVPSLIQYFYNFDFAITGGGVTCCEANATGLPCYIIANAKHEENTGRFMEEIGGSLYLGAFGNWDLKAIKSINELDINKMSQKGIENFDTNAINRIFSIIKEEWETYEK